MLGYTVAPNIVTGHFEVEDIGFRVSGRIRMGGFSVRLCLAIGGRQMLEIVSRFHLFSTLKAAGNASNLIWSGLGFGV